MRIFIGCEVEDDFLVDAVFIIASYSADYCLGFDNFWKGRQPKLHALDFSAVKATVVVALPLQR